jgi:hypothetical protein
MSWTSADFPKAALAQQRANQKVQLSQQTYLCERRPFCKHSTLPAVCHFSIGFERKHRAHLRLAFLRIGSPTRSSRLEGSAALLAAS